MAGLANIGSGYVSQTLASSTRTIVTGSTAAVYLGVIHCRDRYPQTGAMAGFTYVAGINVGS